MPLPAIFARAVAWARAGYPGGVHEQGHIPLVALLGSRLTDDELALIAGELAFSCAPDSAQEIGQAISAITRIAASDSDVARVRSHLAQ
jgi:uncharacterized protein YqeY